MIHLCGPTATRGPEVLPQHSDPMYYTLAMTYSLQLRSLTTKRATNASSRPLTLADRLKVMLASLLLFQCTGHMCTAMGIDDTATVHFAPPITGAGSWCFEIEASALHCVTCATVSTGQPNTGDAGGVAPKATLPPALVDVPQCVDGYARYQDDIAVSLQGDSVSTDAYRDVNTLSVSSRSNLQQLMPSLTYRAYLGAESRYQRDVQFIYQDFEGNGQGCGVNHRADIETSP